MRPDHGPRAKSRRRVGVLLGDSNEEYQAAVVRGMRAMAKERGVQLRSFVGGELGSASGTDRERNLLFGMVGPDNVDALVVMAGAIANLCGRGGLAHFCARFQRMPMCTLSGELPGVPNVVADNRAGVREAVSHLALVHRRTRIAFIRGPIENQDAQERYEAYVSALAENGLAFDPARVFEGNFSPQSGQIAIAEACERKQAFLPGDVDSIIAADDSTALGALRELARRQIHVPQKVSVIGFDDVDEARISVPPLTTIKQPLAELGAEAVRVVCALLDGERPPLRVTFPTKAVIRRSCGCGGGLASQDGQTRRRSFEAELLARKDVVRAELQRTTRGAFGAATGWDERLVMTFAEQVRGGSDAFVRAFRTMLEMLADGGTAPPALGSMLATLRTQMLACLGQDMDLAERVEDVIREARAVAANYAPLGSSGPRSSPPKR
jgi:sigma-B regulation protein RsbU (phosphoserine phosphatase)